MLQFARTFAMPNAETFTVPPIGAFVQRYLAASKVSVDPFARNRSWATYTNDLNPATSAQSRRPQRHDLRCRASPARCASPPTKGDVMRAVDSGERNAEG